MRQRALTQCTCVGVDVPLRRDDEGDGGDHDDRDDRRSPRLPSSAAQEATGAPRRPHGGARSGNGRTDGRRAPAAPAPAAAVQRDHRHDHGPQRTRVCSCRTATTWPLGLSGAVTGSGCLSDRLRQPWGRCGTVPALVEEGGSEQSSLLDQERPHGHFVAARPTRRELGPGARRRTVPTAISGVRDSNSITPSSGSHPGPNLEVAQSRVQTLDCPACHEQLHSLLHQ